MQLAERVAGRPMPYTLLARIPEAQVVPLAGK